MPHWSRSSTGIDIITPTIMPTAPQSTMHATGTTDQFSVRKQSWDYRPELFTPALRNRSRACRASGECG